MPKFLEDKLKTAAAKKGYTGPKADAYVFGTMNKLGAIHGNQETAKGAAMQKKHDAKATPPKKKKHPLPMHTRMAAAMSRTRTSTPPEPDGDEGNY